MTRESVSREQKYSFYHYNCVHGIGHALALGDGKRLRGHHLADGPVKGRIAALLEEPGQVAIGKDAG